MTGRATIDRLTAARLLRDARGGGENDDAVEWTFSMMPDSRAARRLWIERLLHDRDYEAADALIARCLRHRPTDASLCLLRARSLFAQGDHVAAGRELRLVLARRPSHRGALELAGRVALEIGEPLRAVAFFQRAERRRADDGIRARIATAWLDAGRPRMARRVLRRMQAPPVLLRSRVLEAEGRLLEAIALLDESRRSAPPPPQCDAIVCNLIDLLERTADLQRLRKLLADSDTRRPEVLARAGTAWLAMGAFHTAAVRMAALARLPGYRARAFTVLMVAAAMMNRPRLARRALDRLRRINEPVEPVRVADAWGRGLLGRLMLDQCSARLAGADPHTGQLGRLLTDAANVFRDELDGAGPEVTPPQRIELCRHLAVCEQVSNLAAGPAAGPAPLADARGHRPPVSLAA